MASAHLVFGNIANNQAVLTTDFRSVELNTGDTYTFTSASKNYLIITALVNIYVAFTSDGSAPNTAVSPRIYIGAGNSYPVYIRDGVKVSVLNA